MTDTQKTIPENSASDETDAQILITREYFAVNSIYVTEMVNHFLSTDKSKRNIGEIYYRVLLENPNFPQIVTHCHFNENLEIHVRNYCLVLLKRYLIGDKDEEQNRRRKYRNIGENDKNDSKKEMYDKNYNINKDMDENDDKIGNYKEIDNKKNNINEIVDKNCNYNEKYKEKENSNEYDNNGEIIVTDKLLLQRKFDFVDLMFMPFLKVVLERTDLKTHPLIDIISVMIIANRQKAHSYLDQLFSAYFSSRHHLSIFCIIKQLISNLNPKKDSHMFFTITRYSTKIFLLLGDKNASISLRIAACKVILAFLRKLFDDLKNNDDVILTFKDEYKVHYSSILEALEPSYDERWVKFLTLVIKIIKLLNFACYSQFLRSDDFVSRLGRIVNELTVSYQFHSADKDAVLCRYQKLFSKIIKITCILMNSKCSPLEFNYISHLVSCGLSFIKLESRVIYCFRKFKNSPEDSSSQSSASSITKSGIDVSTLNSMRPLYLRLFNPVYQQNYQESLIFLYNKIEEIFDKWLVEKSELYQYWEELEVCLWLISETGLVYFLNPGANRQLYEKINKGIIKAREQIINPLVYWQAILASLLLCLIYPNSIHHKIINEIYKTIDNGDQLVFNHVYACKALQRMCKIIIFNYSLSQEFKNKIKNFTNFIFHQLDSSSFDDEVFTFYFQTYHEILMNSKDQIFEYLDKYFQIIFRCIKYTQSYLLCNTLVESFDEMANYLSIGKKFSSKVYPHVIEALRPEFDPELFATNVFFCEIISILLNSESFQLELEQINKLYFMIHRMMEYDDCQIIQKIIEITKICAYRYGSQFKISYHLDGILNSSLVVDITDKYLASLELMNNCSLIELINTAFVKIPSFKKTPRILRILFKVTLNLQNIKYEISEVEFHLLAMFSFFIFLTEETIALFMRLKGMFTKIAFPRMFCIWFDYHTLQTYSHQFYYRYSAHTLIKIFEYIIKTKSPFLETFITYFRLQHILDPVKINLGIATAYLLLQTYWTIKSWKRREISYPSSLNPQCWENFEPEYSDYNLLIRIENVFKKFNQKLYEDLDPILSVTMKEDLKALLLIIRKE